MTEFDPNRHTVNIKGKLYLPARARIAWFRATVEGGQITTEVVSINPPVVKATISAHGEIIATAHAGLQGRGGEVWDGRGIEKNETAAINRALIHAGLMLPGEVVPGGGGRDDRQPIPGVRQKLGTGTEPRRIGGDPQPAAAPQPAVTQPAARDTYKAPEKVGDGDYLVSRAAVRTYVKKNGQPKTYVQLWDEQNNHIANIYSRQMLREAGYNVDGMDVGNDVPLDPQAIITIRDAKVIKIEKHIVFDF